MNFLRRRSHREPYFVPETLYRPKPREQSFFGGNLYRRPPREMEEASENVNDILYRLFLKKNIDIGTSVKLGAGRYSKVITARQGNEMIAIKIINTEKVTREFKEKFLPREIACWRQLRHPNLVRILGHYEALKYVFLTMEFGVKGDLLSYVQRHGALAEERTRSWLTQIIQGVDFIHSAGIAHRDLKLENIIVFSETFIKVADFGFARKMVEPDAHSTTFCGSKSYSTPEVLSGRPYDPFKSDVWSIGVTSFIMVTDTMPFREDVGNRAMVKSQRNKSYHFPANLDPACIYSIEKMMTFDPKLPNDQSLLVDFFSNSIIKYFAGGFWFFLGTLHQLQPSTYFRT